MNIHNGPMSRGEVSDVWLRLRELLPDMKDRDRVPELMRICGVRQATVSRWKTGVKPIGKKSMTRLVQHFRVSRDWLEDGVGNKYIATDDDPFIQSLRADLDNLTDQDKEELAHLSRLKALRNRGQ